MNQIVLILLYAISGIFAGVFGGLGMGGGTILIPLLTILFSMPQKLSQGINLLSFLAMGTISLIIHYKNGFIKMDGLLILILSGLLFSLGGAFLAGAINGAILRRLFGAFLSILSIFELKKAIFQPKGENKKNK